MNQKDRLKKHCIKFKDELQLLLELSGVKKVEISETLSGREIIKFIVDEKKYQSIAFVVFVDELNNGLRGEK